LASPLSFGDRAEILVEVGFLPRFDDVDDSARLEIEQDAAVLLVGLAREADLVYAEYLRHREPAELGVRLIEQLNAPHRRAMVLLGDPREGHVRREIRDHPVPFRGRDLPFGRDALEVEGEGPPAFPATVDDPPDAEDVGRGVRLVAPHGGEVMGVDLNVGDRLAERAFGGFFNAFYPLKMGLISPQKRPLKIEIFGV
jgi:hypothetical protein